MRRSRRAWREACRGGGNDRDLDELGGRWVEAMPNNEKEVRGMVAACVCEGVRGEMEGAGIADRARQPGRER